MTPVLVNKGSYDMVTREITRSDLSQDLGSGQHPAKGCMAALAAALKS